MFSIVSDGLLIAEPEPPEKIWLQRTNAMGLHARDARIELVLDGTTVPRTATVGELLEYLYTRCEISRRQRITLSFWGKPLDDERKTLEQYKVITNSELTMKTTTRSLTELAAIRQAAPLQRVRVSSHKLAPFAIEALSPVTTAGALRAAIHAHIHAPLTYLAVVDWKTEVSARARRPRARVPARAALTVRARATCWARWWRAGGHAQVPKGRPAREGLERRRRQKGQGWRGQNATPAKWSCRRGRGLRVVGRVQGGARGRAPLLRIEDAAR